MIEVPNSSEGTVMKIDGCFNQGRLKAIKSNTIYSFYCVIKIIALGGLALWAFPKELDSPYHHSIILGLVLNILQLAVFIGIIKQMKDLEQTLIVANLVGHAREEEVVAAEAFQMIQLRGTIESRVSEIYDFRGNLDPIIQDSVSKLANVTESHYIERVGWIIVLRSVCSMLGLFFIFQMAHNLIKFRSSPATKIVSFFCLFLQVVMRLDILFLLVILAILIPIIILACCLICVCRCFCAQRLVRLIPILRGPDQEPFNIQNHPQLQPVQFSADLILQTQNQCKICFQNFSLGDKILILPCNNKHVFHEFCITSWFRVAQTCPLCRKPLSQMVVQMP